MARRGNWSLDLGLLPAGRADDRGPQARRARSARRIPRRARPARRRDCPPPTRSGCATARPSHTGWRSGWRRSPAETPGSAPTSAWRSLSDTPRRSSTWRRAPRSTPSPPSSFVGNPPIAGYPGACMEPSVSGVGYEATQRHGRHAAVQRDAEPAHPHPEGGDHPRRRLRGRVHVRRLPPNGRAPAASTGSAALPTHRHPVETAPPDVDGGLPRRPRLSPAPRAGARARAAAANSTR